MGHRIAVGLLVGAVALVPTGAWAQKEPAKAPAGAISAADITTAKKRYADGEKKLKAGDFEGALPDFTAANEIKATPQAERNIGLCEDNLGHYRAAVEWYEKFLAHVPDKLAVQGDEIRKRVAAVRAMPGKLRIESNPAGATVTVDGKPQNGTTPLDVELPIGSHEIKLAESGRLPSTKSVDIAYASTQTVTVDLESEPPPAPPPPPVVAATPLPDNPPAPPPAEPHSLVPAFVTGGLAIAAAGVGTVFGVIALQDKSDFDKNPTTQKADDGDTHSLIADMAFGVAVTFGVTSAVLFLTKDEPAPSASATPRREVAHATSDRIKFTPTPMVGPHLAGGGFVLQF